MCKIILVALGWLANAVSHSRLTDVFKWVWIDLLCCYPFNFHTLEIDQNFSSFTDCHPYVCCFIVHLYSAVHLLSIFVQYILLHAVVFCVVLRLYCHLWAYHYWVYSACGNLKWLYFICCLVPALDGLELLLLLIWSSMRSRNMVCVCSFIFAAFRLYKRMSHPLLSFSITSY